MESQENDPESLLNWTRRLIEFRKTTPAFWADSEFTPVYNAQKPYPMVYTRSEGKETWIVALNPTGKKQVVNLPAGICPGKGSVSPEISHGKVSLKDGKLSMGPTSVLIARLPD